MKPFRIFLLLFGIFIVIGLISIVTKAKGIHIADGFEIRIPSVFDLFHPPAAEYADITKISQDDKADSVVAFKTVKPDHPHDSVPHPAINQFLEYPDSSKRSLDTFFSMLAEMSPSKECIHILHYGDSQLEADRITEYLRFRFQGEFGGNGPGLLSFNEEASRTSLQITTSGNWSRFGLFGTPYSQQGKRPYGALASYFRFTRLQDSLNPVSESKDAWIRISGAGRSYGKSKLGIFFNTK